MWYICTMEYYSALKRNEVLLTCYNRDKPWKHYAKYNKSDTKGQILYDSTYMKNRQIHRDIK